MFTIISAKSATMPFEGRREESHHGKYVSMVVCDLKLNTVFPLSRKSQIILKDRRL